MAIAALALLIVGCSSQRGEPSVPALDSGTPTSSPSLLPNLASASPLPDLASASPLPDLAMPGTRGDEPAGEYGWEGPSGARTGMHKVIELGGGSRQTQMVFTIQSDCFAGGEGPEPVRVTVASLDGRYVEPYDGPSVTFMHRRESGETTGGYALPIGDRTLCVYFTWDATTTTDELDAARQVVETIRGEAYGPSGIRIIFTLPEGWDTG